MLDLVREVRRTVETDDGSIMLLFRARSQMFRFIDEFIGEGIPFGVMTDQRMWTDRLEQFVDAIEHIDADEPLSALEARRLADMLADSAFGSNERDDLFDAIDEREEESELDDLAEIQVEPEFVTDHVPFMPGPASAADMSRKITSFQTESMKSYFAGDYQDVARDRVRVGTIHSAKGREADHVFVGTDLTEKVVEQMAASVPDPTAVDGVEEFTAHTSPVPLLTDNERRVFYVGMSRARERLVLLENLIGGAPTLPVGVLLHNELRDEDVEEMLERAQETPVPEPEP
jgi:DNA helicase-2/ATP-dependent DNA helicase PcrA